MTMNDHPCLCDICLSARDAELKRLHTATKEKVLKEVERRMPVIKTGGYTEYMDGFREGQADGIEQVKEILQNLREGK